MITIRITEEELVKAGACAEGISLWRSIAKPSKSGKMRVRATWTPLHQVWLAAAYPIFHGWLAEKGLIPRANLREANLREADLRGANLSGASLIGANLIGADLREANLGGADLREANLIGANLGGADLRGANMSRANLREANLYGAYLYGADLREANLRGADPNSCILPNGVSFEEYVADPLAEICTENESRSRAIAAWGHHSWTSCPMQAAHGWGSIEDAPTDKRLAVAQFVALFDSGLLQKPSDVLDTGGAE